LGLCVNPRLKLLMYQMHRIYCATPWELEEERQVFYTTVGECNETSAMSHGVLYVPLSLGNVPDKRPYQYAVKENIRACRYYIQVLDVLPPHQPPTMIWGPPQRNFEYDLRLALACRADPALPMCEVVVFLKGPTSSRVDLDGVSAVIEFSDTAKFKRQLLGLLPQWLETVTVS
jgi:hypothetical protein